MRASISRTELFAFARSLGANPHDTQSIEIGTYDVTVTSLRRDEEGNVANGAEVTKILVVGDGDRPTVRMRHPNLDAEIDVPASSIGQHAAAGWEVVPSVLDAARELVGVPYVPGGGTAEKSAPEPQDSPEPPAPDTQNTPSGRRKTTKEG